MMSKRRPVRVREASGGCILIGVRCRVAAVSRSLSLTALVGVGASEVLRWVNAAACRNGM